MNYQLTQLPIYQILRLNLFDGLGHHFLRRDSGLLVVAHLDARRRSGQQLPGAGAGGDDELERVGELGTVNHENVLTMVSASACIRCSRARSLTTMPRRRSTAAATSSLMTTKSYSVYAATSSRATCSRRWIAASLSLLRPRSRCSRTANDGGMTNTVRDRRPCPRTLRAPCTSMTSTTSSPPDSMRSVSAAQVP